MLNLYEPTALEDPSEMYDPLPRGAGRIAFPSGDVRSFQFQPPSVENANAALRDAAARQQKFDTLQRIAQQEFQDKQDMDDLMANLRVENAAKAVQMAKNFQNQRKFQRETERGIAEDLTPLEATARAAAMYPMGVGGGSQAAALINAAKKPVVPSLEAVDFGGDERGVMGTGGATYHRFPSPVEKAPTLISQLSYYRDVERSLMARLTAGQPPDPEQLSRVRKIIAQLETQLPSSPPAGAAKIPSASTAQVAGTAGEVSNGPPTPTIGVVYKGYRLNGKYPASDKRAWDKIK